MWQVIYPLVLFFSVSVEEKKDRRSVKLFLLVPSFSNSQHQLSKFISSGFVLSIIFIKRGSYTPFSKIYTLYLHVLTVQKNLLSSQITLTNYEIHRARSSFIF